MSQMRNDNRPRQSAGRVDYLQRAKERFASAVEEQARAVKDCREESCLDRRVPLGTPMAAKPEFGPYAPRYYAGKHERGAYGRFWPLHKTRSPLR
jgi:hypothetical protein